VDELLECYREVARDVALERLVLDDVGDHDTAIEEGSDHAGLLKESLLQVHRERFLAGVEVSEAEVEEHFRAHRDDFRSPGRLSLWNIFRRHEDPRKPEATLEFLRELKRRNAAGEPFGALAREYSHSETRLRDGLVGQVAQGRMASALEAVAFRLPEGGVSEPLPVAGGAVLLHVRNVTRGTDMELADVREAIRGRIGEERLRDAIAERTADRDPPQGSLVLAAERLAESFRWEAGRDVLAVREFRLTAGELRRLAGLPAAPGGSPLAGDRRERLVEAYDRQRKLLLLAVDLLESDSEVDREVCDEARRRAREAGRDRLVAQRIRTALEVRVDRDPDRLEGYFEDNRHLYQSPLRFWLRILELPFGANPPAQLAEMERVHEALVEGRLDFEAAAARVGGRIRELGWRDFGELGELPPKARSYLVQVAAGSYTVPFQEDETLHLVWVAGREEPRNATWEEARERVRSDYLARFERDLYLALQEERLEAVGFAFDEERLRQQLGSPDATRSAPGEASPP
jgi:hypothetical protein